MATGIEDDFLRLVFHAGNLQRRHNMKHWIQDMTTKIEQVFLRTCYNYISVLLIIIKVGGV